MSVAASALEIALLGAADRPSLQRTLEIYADAIPAHEQRPAAEVAAMAADPRYRLIVGRVGGELVAFAALFVAAAGGFALLEYLAVDAPWRGRGLGRALLDRALALVRRAAPDLPVLLEVDSADEAAADRPLRLARAAFYRRAGCRRVVGLDYLLPIPGVTPPRMDLWVHAPAIATLDRDLLGGWLRAIYVEVYGRDPGDPRPGRMLEPLPSRVALA